MISGKVWGHSHQLKKSGAVELHRIEANPGGYCSKHFHRTKWNGFYVESGSLVITVWQDSGLVDETHLTAGEYTEVPPGVYHKFHSPEHTVAFELYWAEIQGEDIVRELPGGQKSI